MKNFTLAVIALLASSVALATAPDAPTFTVAATDIKQLQFDITPVTRASTYELWFKPNANANWVKYTETAAQHPRIRINVSVHLLDWRQARYLIKACNPSGCGTSVELGVDGEQFAAMGYLKANAATLVEQFGGRVAASADGKTVVVLDGEHFSNGASNSAVVHVYRKTTATSGWRREARLEPSTRLTATNEPSEGDTLAISGDGTVVVLGLWKERYNGRVWIFRKGPEGWYQAQNLVGVQGFAKGDLYGYNLRLDDAGNTLVVGHSYLNGQTESVLDVFQSTNGGAFTRTAQLRGPLLADGTRAGIGDFALSGDGQTLARVCVEPADGAVNPTFTQVLNAPAWTESARLPGGNIYAIELTGDGRQMITGSQFYKLGPTGWVRESREGYVGYSNEPDGEPRHRTIAISRDGKLAAFGRPYDATAGLGPIYPPYQSAATRSGTVIVYERKPTGSWVIRRLIKPDSTNEQRFGHFVALGDNGRLLVVGAPLDSSAATGIDGDRNDDSAPFRGAVWLY